MSSEHAVEQVPLAEIREGDMLQDPTSGKWIKITRTNDAPGQQQEGSGQDNGATQRHRTYHGDGGEEIDSRLVTGLVNRQVRE